MCFEKSCVKDIRCFRISSQRPLHSNESKSTCFNQLNSLLHRPFPNDIKQHFRLLVNFSTWGYLVMSGSSWTTTAAGKVHTEYDTKMALIRRLILISRLSSASCLSMFCRYSQSMLCCVSSTFRSRLLRLKWKSIC